MEDNEPTPSTTPPPAARTAQALRELHDRARTALAAQRERMGQLEVQLTNQLDSISETLAQQIASHGGTGDESGGYAEQTLQDVEQLRAELERTRLEWDRERELWQAERGQLVAAETGRSQSLDERQQELDTRQQTLDDRAAELNQQDREQRQRQEMLDAHAAQAAEKQTELFSHENVLEKRRAEVAELDAALQKSQLELEQTRENLRARELQLESDQAALTSEREALEAAQTEVVQIQSAMEVASQLNKTQTASRLALLDQQLATERTAWDRERASVEEQRKLLAKERDDLSTALEAARGELTIARADAAAAGELGEVKQNFQSALTDVQRLQVRVEELETELDGRPVVNETDVVELVHLRAEREAMAQRIGELEQLATTAAGAEPNADQSDLQRRLELALDDLRDMKKRNAELESQAESSKHVSGGAPSTGSVSSWEVMKLKMLANLEGEGDGDEDRHAERVKIEEAIRHTDAALARKDRELADLKAQLTEAADAPRDRNVAVEQLIDADEVIAEHRARIAQLELEVTAKLREAEMELSVERAKITRETAHLAGLKAEIDAHRGSGGDVYAAPGAANQPKRRWLSKLGLSGEDDEK